MNTHTLPPRNARRASPRPKDRITDNVMPFRHHLATRVNADALSADDEAGALETLRPDYDLGPTKQVQRDNLACYLIVAATVGACYALIYIFN